MGARRAQFNIFSLIHLQVVGRGDLLVIYLFLTPIDGLFFSDTPRSVIVRKYSALHVINVHAHVQNHRISPALRGASIASFKRMQLRAI